MSLINKGKKNNCRKGKGMTLIEIVISVALLAILFVPLSSIILNLLRVNIKTENKQQAAYLGQSILDELGAGGNFTLISEEEGSYFKLLSGERIYKKSEDIFKQSITKEYKNNQYEIEILINRNFAQNTISNNVLKYSDYDWQLSIMNNKYSLASSWSLETEDKFDHHIMIKIKEDMDIVINENYYDLKGERKNVMVIYLQDEEIREDEKLEIRNESNEIVDIYIIKKDKENYFNISVSGNQANIYHLPLKEEYISGEIYNVNVIIKEKNHGDILFEGDVISKISFN